MAKVPYRCDELDESLWPDPCREFTPSVRRSMTDAEYDAYIEKCEALADDPAAYEAEGCKRQAHFMVSGGRQRLRGKGSPTQEQRAVRLRTLEEAPPATPKRRRTQPSVKRQSGARVGAIESALKNVLRRREREGLPTTVFVPGAVPADLTRVLRKFALPRRATAFRELFKRYGLRFLPERLPELPQKVRLLAFAHGLAVLGVGVRDPRGGFAPRIFADGAELRAVVVNGTRNTRIVRKLNEAFDDLRTRNQSSLVITLAGFDILMRLLGGLATPGSAPPSIDGFQFGSGRIMLPRRAVKSMAALGEDDPDAIGLSVPELQHLISGVRSDVRLKPDMKKLRYVTPEALAQWLSGSTLKRTRRKGRRSEPLQSPTKASENPMARRKKTRRNPRSKSGGLVRLSSGSGESFGISKISSSSSRTTPTRAVPSRSIGVVGSKAKAPSRAKKRVPPKRRRAPARRGPVRVGTPAFDPLAELIKEFTPQHKTQRRVRRSPNLAKPTRFSDDPYAISKDPYGPRNSLPTNRRNPRRKQARSNPGAKAAMELHHSTGMSLKQAWKCVKRGDTPFDFGSQYEYRRGAFTAADAMPPVNRRNPSLRARNNSESSKALRMMHRHGISLEEAWERVKAGEAVPPRTKPLRAKKPSYKRSMSYTKKARRRKEARSNPNAAAAMELHHDEGISLKQAWKRVKRGDY